MVNRQQDIFSNNGLVISIVKPATLAKIDTRAKISVTSGTFSFFTVRRHQNVKNVLQGSCFCLYHCRFLWRWEWWQKLLACLVCFSPFGQGGCAWLIFLPATTLPEFFAGFESGLGLVTGLAVGLVSEVVGAVSEVVSGFGVAITGLYSRELK